MDSNNQTKIRLYFFISDRSLFRLHNIFNNFRRVFFSSFSYNKIHDACNDHGNSAYNKSIYTLIIKHAAYKKSKNGNGNDLWNYDKNIKYTHIETHFLRR